MNKLNNSINIRIGDQIMGTFKYSDNLSRDRAIVKALAKIFDVILGSDADPWEYIYDGDFRIQ